MKTSYKRDHENIIPLSQNELMNLGNIYRKVYEILTQ